MLSHVLCCHYPSVLQGRALVLSGSEARAALSGLLWNFSASDIYAKMCRLKCSVFLSASHVETSVLPVLKDDAISVTKDLRT